MPYALYGCTLCPMPYMAVPYALYGCALCPMPSTLYLTLVPHTLHVGCWPTPYILHAMPYALLLTLDHLLPYALNAVPRVCTLLGSA